MSDDPKQAAESTPWSMSFDSTERIATTMHALVVGLLPDDLRSIAITCASMPYVPETVLYSVMGQTKKTYHANKYTTSPRSVYLPIDDFRLATPEAANSIRQIAREMTSAVEVCCRLYTTVLLLELKSMVDFVIHRPSVTFTYRMHIKIVGDIRPVVTP